MNLGKKLWIGGIFVLNVVVLCTGCGDLEGDKSQQNVSEIVNDTENEAEVADSESTATEEVTETEPEVTGVYDFTLCFGGDISLDEKAVTTAQRKW